MKTPIEQVREALKFGDHVTYAENHFAVVLNAQPEFDQYEVAYRQYDGGGHEYWKTAVCHLADLTALKSLEGQEVEDRELADHYLYMGWLSARPERPWTDEDAREAFLHALKYARQFLQPSTPRLTVDEAMEVVRKWYNELGIIDLNGVSIPDDLRTRLTQAIKP